MLYRLGVTGCGSRVSLRIRRELCVGSTTDQSRNSSAGPNAPCECEVASESHVGPAVQPEELTRGLLRALSALSAAGSSRSIGMVDDDVIHGSHYFSLNLGQIQNC